MIINVDLKKKKKKKDILDFYWKQTRDFFQFNFITKKLWFKKNVSFNSISQLIHSWSINQTELKLIKPLSDADIPARILQRQLTLLHFKTPQH